MDLHGRVALVTGAGQRVGREIALTLARGGARVAVHYNKSVAGARDVVREIAGFGGEAVAVSADLGGHDAPEALVAATLQSFGKIDILVNSASIMEATPLASVAPADWDRIMAINSRAPFFLALAAAKHMYGEREAGVIINIGDLAAYETWPEYPLHGLSKSLISTMTRTLGRLLAPAVRVNCVVPGAVLLPEGWGDERERVIAASTPLGRVGSPSDVAGAVAYFVGADYVTGTTLVVDGGRSVRR